MTDPAAYPRRILLAVTGLTPQIVTETLYALAVERRLWVPTEIRIITTRRGADKAARTLLSEKGWVHRLRQDYGLPAIRFGVEDIHVITGPKGVPLDDILDEADNAAVADFITEEVRKITADPDASLHVSIAGGRKTMGFTSATRCRCSGAHRIGSHMCWCHLRSSRRKTSSIRRPVPRKPACFWAISPLFGCATGYPTACSRAMLAFPRPSPKRRRRCRRSHSVSTRRRDR
jgi:CRISPR-associated protein NE0113 (Cas_NE0113)